MEDNKATITMMEMIVSIAMSGGIEIMLTMMWMTMLWMTMLTMMWMMKHSNVGGLDEVVTLAIVLICLCQLLCVLLSRFCLGLAGAIVLALIVMTTTMTILVMMTAVKIVLGAGMAMVGVFGGP